MNGLPHSTVNDNRLVRGLPQYTTTLGQTLSATFGTPMTGSLISRQTDIQKARESAFDEDQQAEFFSAETARQKQISDLQWEYYSETDPSARDEIGGRIEAIQAESNTQADAMTRDSIEAGRLQTPETLGDQYGDLGLEFDRPMSQQEADLLAQGRREEIIRNSIIQAGPQGVVPGIARFGAGLAAMAVDPVELASMFIPIVGQAGRAASVARLGKIGGRAAVGATEGFVGSLLTEPLMYGLSVGQQLDYSMSDALLNVGLGTILGGGIGAGIGVLSRGSSPKRIDAEPLEAVDMQVKAELPANISGLRIRDARPETSMIAVNRVVGGDSQSADVAIRQFISGQSVEVFRQNMVPVGIRIEPEFDDAGTLLGVSRTANGQLEYQVEPAPVAFGKAADNAETIPRIDDNPELPRTESWVAVDRKTGKAVFETFNRSTAQRINQDSYGMIPTQVYLERLNQRIKETGEARLKASDVRDMSDISLDVGRLDPPDLARNAQDPQFDPLADFDASIRADVEVPDQFTDAAIADIEGAVIALEKTGSLGEEAHADLIAIREHGLRAKKYAAASRAMANCMVGT